MNKKITLLALLFVLPLGIFAQSIELSGTVKDSIGAPLELANIIATVKSSGEIESYGITDSRGRYRLDLPKGGTYELKVSYLGLKTEIEELTVPEDGQDVAKDFVLKADPNQLDDVELVYEIPVTVKGDTIVYNTDSFTNGTERKLGDVLDKLPGVEVNDDGEIEVEGKAVSKVMVEGKDFFDGDSKLATQNIPADAVKKVEVLKNYNEVSQLRGLGNDQDNIAINIKLKEGKKNFWFGDITAGGGGSEDESRYLVKPKLFYYSPKGSINIISNFNNVGDVPFTFRDYFNFTGGFRNFNQRGGTAFNISDGGLGFLTTQNNRANELESGFVAANFTYTATPTWDISGFALLSDNRTDFINNSLNTFINQGVTQEFNQISDQQNQLAMAKFSSVYKPNANFQLDYDILGKLSSQEEISNGISREFRADGTTEDIVDENKDNEPFSINQNVNIYYTLNDKNIFAATVQHLYQDENPFYQALLSQEPFATSEPPFIIDPDTGETIPNPNAGETLSLLPFQGISDTSLFDVNQDNNVQSNKLDAKVDYYYVLNKKSNLNFTLGTTLSRQDFNSNLFQILENGNRFDLDETLGDNSSSLDNDVRFNFTDLFLGLHYKVKSGKFTFTPGVTLHNYTVTSEQQGSRTSEDKTLLLPDLFVDFQLRQSQNIRFNYRLTAQYTDVNNYAEGLVLNNFNRLSGGNRNLENALFHTVSLNYFSFSMFNFTSIFGGINYTSRVDPIKSVGSFAGINQASTPINNTDFNDQTISANGRFSKTFKKLKWNISGNVSFSDLNNIINGENRNTQNLNQNYRTSLETNFKNAPNFEVGFSRQITNSDNGFTDRTFFTDRPFANFEVNFLKRFTFAADWEYFNYDDNDDSTDLLNTYQFLEANLYYQKPDSKWEFRVQATNLLDVDVISQNNVNDISISNTEFFVQPRIVMFTVKYDL